MKKRICEVCDIPLMPDYEFSICAECADMFRALLKEPVTEMVDSDCDSEMVN